MILYQPGRNALKMNLTAKSVKVRREKKLIEMNRATFVKNVKNGYVSDAQGSNAKSQLN